MELLNIIYQDEHYVAIDKPSGLLVHRSEIDRHETRFALQMLRDQIGQHVYSIHRLDKPTSGVLLFGLTAEAAQKAQQLFEQRRVQKTYQAIVRGVADNSGTIDYALSDKREAREKRHPDKVREPQDAVTHYRTLATVELPFAIGQYNSARYSWLELNPETGRKHQLRRHLHHISHPIIGDTRYGKGQHNRLFRDQFDVHRLLLWATELQLLHPYTEQPLILQAQIPDIAQRLFQQFNWQQALSSHRTYSHLP